MKKICLLLLIVAMTVIAAGCSSSQTAGGDAASAKPAENETTQSSESAEAAETPVNDAAENEPSEQADTTEGNTESEQAAPILNYYGHASMRIDTEDGHVIYIDPFASGDYTHAADLILVTHGHYDHSDLELISSRNEDCAVITHEEALSDGQHQSFDFSFVKVEAVEAGNNENHDIRECVGYVLTFNNGKTVYVSGDTSTTEQMSALAAKQIDYAFFCCDGVYNMDLDEAAKCAQAVGAKHNIPYHNTTPDAGEFYSNERAEQFNAPNKMIVKPGESFPIV